ncbi:MAG: hypothetical protein ACXABY_04060 [Candidatus Thorarchaeota archaeon]|jgi:hypothetical protein
MGKKKEVEENIIPNLDVVETHSNLDGDPEEMEIRPDTAGAETKVVEEEKSEEKVEETPQETDTPDRWKGKSLGDVIAAHAELEKTMGRQSDELGTYRKLFDQHATKAAPTNGEAPEKSLQDKFFENPEEFKREMREDNAAYTMQQIAIREGLEKLNSDFPNRTETVQSDDFRSWAMENVPPQILQQGDTDPRTAHFILDRYKKDRVGAKTEEHALRESVEREQQVRSAQTPTSTARDNVSTSPKFTRHELAKMMMERPDEYAARQTEILQAYAAGQVK